MSSTALRAVAAAFVLYGTLTSLAPAQGAGSCGVHLDILANLTSTHSAVADVPGYPGAFAGYPVFAPGNPYHAYCVPGTVAKFRLTVAPSTLGPAPFGAGSVVSILYSVGTPPVPVFPPVGFLGTCVAGAPWVISILPPAGAIVDGMGLLSALPLPPPADPGHPFKLEIPVAVPPIFPFGVPVFFQAVITSPFGAVGVSNGVALVGGPSPFEVSLLPGLVPTGVFPALDEGSVTLPTPPGFFFYGLPAPLCHVNTNGHVSFDPAPPLAADFVGTVGDLGCAPPTPTASARLAVNHFDADFGAAPTAPRIADLTAEFDPGVFGVPRLILRWKNVPNFGAPPPLIDTNYASMSCEIWGGSAAGPGGRMIIVRQEQHAVTTLAQHDMIGIGPGVGPPPVCAAVPLWTLWGFPPFIGVPGGAIAQDTVLDSMLLSNLAVVFDPIFPALVPTAYAVSVY